MQFRKLFLGLLLLSFLIEGCGGGTSFFVPAVSAASPTPQTVIVTGSCSQVQQFGADADYWLFNLGQVDNVACSPSSSVNFGLPAPAPGTIVGLAVAANGTSGGVLTVWVNNTASNLTCTIASGACRSAGAVAFTTGDVIGIKLHVPAGQSYASIRAVVVAQT